MEMDAYNVNAFSSDEEERPRPRIFRPRINYFEEYDEYDFFCRFRLMPRTVDGLLEELEDLIAHRTNRNECLSPSQQLLLTLNFYASGSFLRVVGDSSGVSKPTASRVVRRVSQAIASLRPTYIKMPVAEEVEIVRQSFYNIAKFPLCIGAIDCSHVKIQSPGGENPEIYRNRKQFFSFNVQSVADADLKFRDIVARWPGSSHDAHIFRNSVLYHNFERGQYGDSLLIGDSGYPTKPRAKPYLLTPLRDVRNGAEALYNESIIRTRNVVERKYGVWKRRFPALAMGLRLKSLDTIQAVIVATAILHNKARDENERLPPINVEQEQAVNLLNDINILNIEEGPLGANQVTRNNLINNYFASL